MHSLSPLSRLVRAKKPINLGNAQSGVWRIYHNTVSQHRGITEFALSFLSVEIYLKKIQERLVYINLTTIKIVANVSFNGYALAITV